jgi:hypothetical protein
MVRMNIRGHAGLIDLTSPGIDFLELQLPGAVTDGAHLRGAFEWIAELLRGIRGLGLEPDDEVGVQIARLAPPGGHLDRGPIPHDFDGPRHDAAERLGQLKHPRGVGPLVAVLDDSDAELHDRAVRALGEIGDRRAVGPLISLLVTESTGLRASLPAEALRKLGEQECVDAFEQAFRGDPHPLSQVAGKWHSRFVSELLEALASPSKNGRQVSHAATALAALGAVEALPELRKQLRSSSVPEVQAALRAAIAELEAHGQLPRPAEPARGRRDSLPRPVSGSSIAGSELPRPASKTKSSGREDQA